MSDNFKELASQLSKKIADAETQQDLEEVRLQTLGKRGEISLLLQKIKDIPQQQRKAFGETINQLKEQITQEITTKKAHLDELQLEKTLAHEKIDVSLPHRPDETASLHPIRQVTNEIIAIFAEMGFICAEGPEIENDFYNFTALNIPADHPARQMQDTFYVNSDNPDEAPKVLRTHTSPVQIRTMSETSPPIRVIAPGRTYRCDSDITHTPMFHQVEGLVVDDSCHFGHLKGCLYDFCREYFGVGDICLRFRPSYFPFTEPSAEVDIGCSRQDGQLILGGDSDWMEILGCGMVHPNVLNNCGIDSASYRGFAFGIGIERLAMLKYGISDLRTFFDGDLRWLKHYGFSPLSVPSLIRGLNI